MNEKNGILKNVLKEELDRLNRIESVYKEELINLPKGKVMFKNIKGKKYPYLQYRLGSKIKSIYISDRIELNDTEHKVAKRKELEQAIKRVNSEKKQLERAVKIMSNKKIVGKEIKNGIKL